MRFIFSSELISRPAFLEKSKELRFTLEQAEKVQKRNRGIVYSFFSLGAR
jgi:hypothetical protein